MNTSRTPTSIGVGFDTARYGHYVTFLRDDRQPAAEPIVVTENKDGYQKLRQQLQKLQQRFPEAIFRVHIDAAGQYATNLERFLRNLPWEMTISIGEPKRNKDYHAVISPKRKTDRTESHAMARFAVVEQPSGTSAVPESFYLLREILGRLQSQVKDTTRQTNRLHNTLARVFPELATLVKNLSSLWVLKLLSKYPTPSRIAKARLSSLKKIPFLKDELAEKIQAAARESVGSLTGDFAEAIVGEHIESLRECLAAEKRLEKLLEKCFRELPESGHLQVSSIRGIGPVTAAVLVAKIIEIERFETPEKLVGYFGIFPQECSSGLKRNGQPVPPGTMVMSPKGSDIVRRYLWNAAKSAIRHNPAVRDLYARLRANGTRGDVALGHCMRKLLHQVFGVWATNHPYDEQLSQPHRQPVVQMAHEKSVDAETEKTATGHTRACPQSKVVTAAASKLTDAAPNKQAIHQPRQGTIDYGYLRQQITIERVLHQLGYFDRLSGSGHERRGSCPFHSPQRSGSQSFTVNLRKHVFRCCNPDCGAQGNALDLWALAHQLPVYEAALSLANSFQLDTTTEKRQPVSKQKQNTSHQNKPKKQGVITPDTT